ncbi:hypothetical protein BN7_3242 [Wickerhamomyces ciferrii]|uniref:Uncharacterized protein n=1 Tax=Wickerhamomyces ciferrii (strain ATCC 14091 / BCRC 22168 / CBS 111 / JCM 3599 / NBRC 0793 / NRRL Y-1031 F-60-10) TaxID=1206466 RepID=K0KQY0_WICCF|nr:uncharacterized protein BN7_3242 [Wickerhamomyces ciferrii]CCH43688.1 hypothetical protein BN7_3242 [Wickerhamomyces ciferrii]
MGENIGDAGSEPIRPFKNGGEIEDYLEDIRHKKEEELFLKKYTKSNIFDTSLLIAAMNIIKRAPSSNHVREILSGLPENLNKKLSYQVQDPYFSKGINEKDHSNNNGSSLADDEDIYANGNDLITSKDNEIIDKFTKQSQYWTLTPLPEIHDTIWGNQDIDNHIYIGYTYYKGFIAQYILQRFPGEDIELLSHHLSNRLIFKQWGLNYQMPLIKPYTKDQIFLAYLGGLVSEVSFYIDSNEQRIQDWLCILLEPLVSQFESYNETIDDDYHFGIIQDCLVRGLEFEILFETVDEHETPKYLVRVKVDEHVILGSTRSAESSLKAQSKAGSSVLNNPKLKQLALDLKLKSKVDSSGSQKETSVKEGSPDDMDIDDTKSPGVPQIRAHENTIGDHQNQNVNNDHNTKIPHFQSNQRTYTHTETLNQQLKTTSNKILQQQPNEQPNQPNADQLDYQPVEVGELERLKKEEQEQVYQFIPNDEKIDNTAKSVLNEHLKQLKIDKATYKHAVLRSNTDKNYPIKVIVTCYIEGIPIARTTGPNSKITGQIVAKFILDYEDYFLDRLKVGKAA